MKKHTIKEWFEAVEDQGLKERLLDNLRLYPTSPSAADYMVDSLDDAINNGFYWDETKEGPSYWENTEGDAAEGIIPFSFSSTSKGKTIGEWIDTIYDADIRVKLRTNILKHCVEGKVNERADSLPKVINLFIWSKTIEGGGYWSHISSKAIQGKLGSTEVENIPPKSASFILPEKWAFKGPLKDSSLIQALNSLTGVGRARGLRYSIASYYIWDKERQDFNIRNHADYIPIYTEQELISIIHLLTNKTTESHEHGKPAKDGTAIIAFKPVATVTPGKRATGVAVSGRRGRATVELGHLGYQASNCNLPAGNSSGQNR